MIGVIVAGLGKDVTESLSRSLLMNECHFKTKNTFIYLCHSGGEITGNFTSAAFEDLSKFFDIS